MTRAWNTLRVKMTALMVAAILLVVGFASLISFFLADGGQMQRMDDAIAERLSLIVRLVEGGAMAEATKADLVKDTLPAGHVIEGPSRGVTEAMARLGHPHAVTLVDPGEPHRSIAAIRLSDGRYLAIPAGMPPGPPPSRFPQMVAWLALIALGTTGVTVFAINRLTRPLALIEDAIADVSASGELPHIAEAGTTETRAAARTINRLSAQLKAAMDSRMRIVAAAAHDFRTPLTRMRLRAEFLPEDSDREKWLQDLEDLDRIADSAIRLVREEVQPQAKAPVALDAVAAEVVQELTQMGLEASLVQREPVQVESHPAGLKRAVRNLAINAATHGVRARLSVRAEGASAVLQIEDDGPGIPEALLPRVFEPFFRVDPARQATIPGAGLGLAIAKEIIERQGGRLTLSNGASGGLVQRVSMTAKA